MAMTLLYFSFSFAIIIHSCLKFYLIKVPRDASWRSCHQSPLIIWCSPDRNFLTVLHRPQMHPQRTIWFCKQDINSTICPPDIYIFIRFKPLKWAIPKFKGCWLRSGQRAKSAKQHLLSTSFHCGECVIYQPQPTKPILCHRAHSAAYK